MNDRADRGTVPDVSSGVSRHLLPHGPKEGLPALRLLVLGGTSEASALAQALAGRSDVAPLVSFAGRTEKPVPPPIPFRIGGFGGVAGLVAFLRDEAIDAVIDATHPFAARISANAAAACRQTHVPLAVFTRPAWSPLVTSEKAPQIPHPEPPAQMASRRTSDLAVPQAGPAGLPGMAGRFFLDGISGPPPAKPGDRWTPVPDIAGAVALLQGPACRVFLTTGRLDLARFRSVPQHRYLIRCIDAPDPAALPPASTVLLARPPFTVASEMALMQEHGIELLVTKNSGGAASAAKLAAARELGIPVVMVSRPPPSGALELHDLDAVLACIAGLCAAR